MKREQRLVYLELTAEVDWQVCVFCKYNDGSACSGPECKHPLSYRLPYSFGYGIVPDDDCWGFRPSHSIDFAADIIGAVLSQGWRNNGAVWWEEDGKVMIAEFDS